MLPINFPGIVLVMGVMLKLEYQSKDISWEVIIKKIDFKSIYLLSLSISISFKI